MITVASAVVVGVVFLVAAVTKMAAPSQWHSDAAGLGVPRWVARVVPWCEAMLGAALVVQIGRSPVAWAAAAVLSTFSALLVVTLARGRRPVCACFGRLRARPISPVTVGRNLVLVGLSVVAALG